MVYRSVSPVASNIISFMKKIFSILILLGCCTFLFFSCDKISEPYLRNQGIVIHPTDSLFRKVLIEEFTGHKCPTCPDYAVFTEDMLAKYPDQVIALAIHAGPQADTFAYGTEKFYLNSKPGDSLYHNIFNVPGTPKGMVSRSGFPGSHLLKQDQLETRIISLIDLEPKVMLKITDTYDTNTRKVTVNIQTRFLKDADTTYFLAAYLSEDNIISPQIHGIDIIPNYNHSHVLRATFNGALGTQIANYQVHAGKFLYNGYTMNLKPDWKAANCNIIAFVYRGDNYEIVQVEEKKLK
jgi:hypothetical protein